MNMQSSLDSFGFSQKKKIRNSSLVTSLKEINSQILPNDLSKSNYKSTVNYPKYPKNLPASYLVSVKYDGKKGLASLRLYEPISKKIYFWDDNTGHKPYCLTSLPPKEVEKLDRVLSSREESIRCT